MPTKLSNINIVSQDVLMSPATLKALYPRTAKASNTIEQGRRAIEAILDGSDHRLLVITGPCSIHDIKAAKEYATRLKTLQQRYSDTLCIVMRVYFEKPRTTVGWKGLINDPHLNDTFDIETGLKTARELLQWLAELGLPTGTEALDPISPQYLSDLFSWSAIGARTTESQTHREIASGLSTPTGFKNGTNGSLDVAINALQSAASPHRFLGINEAGSTTVVTTRGNAYGHVILRGGSEPNYDSVHVALAEQSLKKAGLATNLVIDCSHANSHKNHALQPLVAQNIVQQIKEGNRSIVGIMLESHLAAGNQPLGDDLEALQYGVSITDACIDWATTATLLAELDSQLSAVLLGRILS